MKVLSVFFHGFHSDEPAPMGRIAYQRGMASFEFRPEFLLRNIEVSPFTLPLRKGLINAERGLLEGLHGLFHDSLPDGWGLLLMDRALQSQGIDTSTLSPIDRLALIGSRGMGAISYEPDEGASKTGTTVRDFDLTKAGSEATRIYEGSLDEVIDYHTIHGTPSGGARPKLLVGISQQGNAIAGSEDLPPGYEHWIVKFPTGATPDKKAEGAMEYIYAQMAKASEINMAECQLIPADDGNAYFATKRFDRDVNNRRNHVHSVAGLLNATFREPNYDYVKLTKLTLELTKSVAEQRELFKRMLFNIVSGNRDDHTKNFAFMMKPEGAWVNSPAYDITFNQGIAGEHNMTIAGKGKDVTLDDLLAVGRHASLRKTDILSLLDQVRQGTAQFAELAKDYDLPNTIQKQISTYMCKRVDSLSPLQISSYEQHVKSVGTDLGAATDRKASKGPRIG
ncbi:type II toxin-antitoxin system HipA family toxin [Congregibacter litoralis]|nr:type II toxin-antitoxin system HipA family toxin [Congregibacter litoralis]